MKHRRERIGHELTARLAEILQHRVSDPRLADLTVIDVSAAPDASFARVFYRVPGEDRTEAERALDKATPFIRRCLAEGLRMRRVPELDFRYDRSAETGAQVEAILSELDLGESDERAD